jgi:hypothetical protein
MTVKDAVDNKGLTQGTKQSTAHSLICEALVMSSDIGASFIAFINQPGQQRGWCCSKLVCK